MSSTSAARAARASCAALALENAIARKHPKQTLAETPGCGASLGDRRAFFTTPDSVQDIEALRIALHAPKIAVAGVSYGTKVALAYALAHPGNVEFMILDSVVTADGPDPFERSNLRAVPGVLRSICKASACRPTTRDPVADFLKVLARIRVKAMHGVFYDSKGRARKTTLTPRSLLDALYAGTSTRCCARGAGRAQGPSARRQGADLPRARRGLPGRHLRRSAVALDGTLLRHLV